MAAEKSREVLRKELGFEERQSFEDILRAFGRDGCDAEGIVLRVCPFLVSDLDLQAKHNRRDRPERADWFELILALAEQKLHDLPTGITHTEDNRASGPYSPDEAEALEKAYPDQVFHKFNSGPCFAMIRDVLCQANRLLKRFPTPPMPESDGRLSVEKTREYLSQISGWAGDRLEGSDDPERDEAVASVNGPISKGLLKKIWCYRNKGKQPVSRPKLEQVWQDVKGEAPKNDDQTIHSGLKTLRSELNRKCDQHGLTLSFTSWMSKDWTFELTQD